MRVPGDSCCAKTDAYQATTETGYETITSDFTTTTTYTAAPSIIYFTSTIGETVTLPGQSCLAIPLAYGPPSWAMLNHKQIQL